MDSTQEAVFASLIKIRDEYRKCTDDDAKRALERRFKALRGIFDLGEQFGTLTSPTSPDGGIKPAKQV
jgi:hypothetical protein